MLLANAVIGDEGALRAESQPDPFRNAGKRRRQRRPDGAVEDPERLQVMPAQRRDEAHKISAALPFRSGMLKIDRGRDARLRSEQVPGGARRRREERHLSVRSGRRDGADERQMPDDITDSGLDLNDRSHIGRRIDCR